MLPYFIFHYVHPFSHLHQTVIYHSEFIMNFDQNKTCFPIDFIQKFDWFYFRNTNWNRYISLSFSYIDSDIVDALKLPLFASSPISYIAYNPALNWRGGRSRVAPRAQRETRYKWQAQMAQMFLFAIILYLCTVCIPLSLSFSVFLLLSLAVPPVIYTLSYTFSASNWANKSHRFKGVVHGLEYCDHSGRTNARLG